LGKAIFRGTNFMPWCVRIWKKYLILIVVEKKCFRVSQIKNT
jgi:hypothetical protein